MDDGRDATQHLLRIAEIYRRLRTAQDPHDLLAWSADAVREDLGFEVGLAFAVTPSGLDTRGTRPLAGERAESMRRRALGTAIPLEPGSREAELVRRPESVDDGRTRTLPSTVGRVLDLDPVEILPIAPDSHALALLIASRTGPPLSDAEHRLFTAYAYGVTAALELVVIRMRAQELVAEARRSATSLQALGREMALGSVVLPVDRGFGLTFPPTETRAAADPSSWSELLTTREIRIAELLVEGRSNREIAQTLFLSPETVKSHVSSVLRKLGVGNRAEAVSRLLRLADTAS